MENFILSVSNQSLHYKYGKTIKDNNLKNLKKKKEFLKLVLINIEMIQFLFIIFTVTQQEFPITSKSLLVKGH